MNTLSLVVQQAHKIIISRHAHFTLDQIELYANLEGAFIECKKFVANKKLPHYYFLNINCTIKMVLILQEAK